MRITFGRRAFGAVVLTASLLTSGVSVAGSTVPAATHAGVTLGQHVANLATLPAASHGSAFVADGSDALGAADLTATREALTPGYLAAELHRAGDALRVRLLYLADGATEGVIVERTGTVGASGVRLAHGGSVLALITDLGAGSDGLHTYRIETANGVTTAKGPNPLLCAFELGAVLVGTAACGAASGGWGAVACGVAGGGALIGIGNSETCADPTSAELTPEYQVVNGQGYNSGWYTHQVQLYLKGSDTVAAARQITVPFATCSASQCETIVYRSSQTGISRHGFAPLGCDQVRTVWGTVEYANGWENDSAQVEISNPTC